MAVSARRLRGVRMRQPEELREHEADVVLSERLA